MSKIISGCISKALIFFISLLLLYAFTFIGYTHYKISGELSFTIGYTGGVKKGAQQARNIEYHYKVKSRTYHALGDYEENILQKGGKYLVAYSTSTPSISVILYSYPITDTTNIEELGKTVELSFNDKLNADWDLW